MEPLKFYIRNRHWKKIPSIRYSVEKKLFFDTFVVKKKDQIGMISLLLNTVFWDSV